MNNPNDTNNNDDGRGDPSSNEFQNLFSDGQQEEQEGVNNNYGMQLDNDNVGSDHLVMQLNQHQYRQEVHPQGGRVVNFDVDDTIEGDTTGGDDNAAVINAVVEAVPPPPPLPPPIDVDNVTGAGGGSGAVVIPSNNEEQHREDVIAVDHNNHHNGEEVMIGPRQQPQQQQQPVQEEDVEEEGGAPVEVVKLWEEVAFGLEKQQTGK